MRGSWREARPLGSDLLGGEPGDPAPKKARKKKPKPHPFAGLSPAPNLLALDLASRTGWAWKASGAAPASGAVDLANVTGYERRGSPFHGLSRWLAARSWSFRSDLAATAQLVHGLVLEAPGGGAGRLSLIHAAGLRGIALAWAAEHEIPVVSIAPSSLKLWATGHGRADKPAMIEAARRFWPEWRGEDDNEADALCLAAWGLEQARNAQEVKP